METKLKAITSFLAILSTLETVSERLSTLSCTLMERHIILMILAYLLVMLSSSLLQLNFILFRTGGRRVPYSSM